MLSRVLTHFTKMLEGVIQLFTFIESKLEGSYEHRCIFTLLNICGDIFSYVMLSYLNLPMNSVKPFLELLIIPGVLSPCLSSLVDTFDLSVP